MGEPVLRALDAHRTRTAHLLPFDESGLRGISPHIVHPGIHNCLECRQYPFLCQMGKLQGQYSLPAVPAPPPQGGQGWGGEWGESPTDRNEFVTNRPRASLTSPGLHFGMGGVSGCAHACVLPRCELIGSVPARFLSARR